MDVRAGCRQTDLGRALAAFRGEHRRAEQPADTALVGGHTVGRVALGVLDVGVALAVRLAKIVCRHIVLKIDEALAVTGDLPQRFQRRGLGIIR